MITDQDRNEHIYVRHNHFRESATEGTQPENYQLVIHGSNIAPFKELVQRALNCWPNAHPALKELGDMLTHGKILQDYWSNRTDMKKGN